MPRLIFDLTEEDRDRLEGLRRSMGLRSWADTLRSLIRGEGDAPAMAEPTAPRPSFSHGRSKTVVVPAKRLRVDAPSAPRHVEVPVYTPRPFNPQPKPGKR